MSIKEDEHEAVVLHQTRLLKAGVWRSCLNCDFWAGQCVRFRMMPPPEIVVNSCSEWTNDIPF